MDTQTAYSEDVRNVFEDNMQRWSDALEILASR